MIDEKSEIRRVCVYCGSSPGHDPRHLAAAVELGTLLAKSGIGVVYGGASIGIMGAVADAALAAGGDVDGVIPTVLQHHEVMHTGLSTLHITDSMHQRKSLMNELADAFIALPGGFGTLEELFEIITWAQLGIHAKPIGLLNSGGYYDQLLAFLDTTVEAGFVRRQQFESLLVDTQPAQLLKRIQAHHVQPQPARLNADQT